MNLLMRYIIFYLFALITVFIFYNTVTTQYEKRLEFTKKELSGIEYLEKIDTFVIEFIHCQLLHATDASDAALGQQKELLDKSIDALYEVQARYPYFKDESLNEQFERIKRYALTEEESYEFLDTINHENYVIGDKANLLFEENREVYFLGTLITHYMPEYMISTLIAHNLILELQSKKELSEEKKHIYIEQYKLVHLSSEEIYGIIKLLSQYDDARELFKIIDAIKKDLVVLDGYRDEIIAWNPSEQAFGHYLEVSSELVMLSHDLNKEYRVILYKILNERISSLENKLVLYNILSLMIVVMATIFFIYIYRISTQNVKQTQLITSTNSILDEYVLFSRTDLMGNITEVSSALAKLSGYEKEQLIGKNHRIFKHPDVSTKLYKELWETILEKKVWRGELLNKKQDGGSYWVNLTIVPELDKDGEIISFVAYREDITNQKELQIEKQKTQEALEFKSKFLSNMSHEIRTPLNSIVGLTQVGMKQTDDSEMQEILEKMQGSSKLLVGVINDILDISKIESGKMSVEHVNFNLQHEIENIYSILQFQADTKNIDFNLYYTGIENYNVVGDPLRISQVLTNLLSNAIKFTSEGEVSLSVHNVQDGISFVVEDTGIGIKADQLERLFDEFTQADMETSRIYGGSGLGLAISKSLVELMNGEISVTSEYGKGSQFNVFLPLTHEEVSEQSEQVEAPHTLMNEVSELGAKRILVAEDNKMNQEVLSMLLEDTQLILEFALDGVEAIKMYEAGSYDMIIMDIQMPHMDGYEATQKIRLEDKRIPIVALSANVLQEDKERAYEAGMNDYLSKPVDLRLLHATLLKYLS